MKREELHTWSACEVDGSLDSFIEMLKEHRKNSEKQGYTNLRVAMEDEWGYYDDHWVTFVIYGEKEVKEKKK